MKTERGDKLVLVYNEQNHLTVLFTRPNNVPGLDFEPLT
jgi:hypothetical protein